MTLNCQHDCDTWTQVFIAHASACSEPDAAPVGVHPGPAAGRAVKPDADSLGEPTRGRLPRRPVQTDRQDVGRAQGKPRDDLREVQQVHEVSISTTSVGSQMWVSVVAVTKATNLVSQWRTAEQKSLSLGYRCCQVVMVFVSPYLPLKRAEISSVVRSRLLAQI